METFNFADVDPNFDAPPAVEVGSGQPESSLVVAFYNRPVEIKARSKEAGRPIFGDEVFIRKVIPGQPDVWDRQATAHDFAQYPAQYEHYKRTDGKGVLVQGTPLSEVPFLSRAKIQELQAVKIYSLEQLAGLSDAVIAKFGLDTRERVEKAKAFICLAQDTAEVTKQAQELIEARREIEDLNERVKALEDENRALRTLVDGEKKGRKQ